MRALTAPFMYCLFYIGEPCTHFNNLKRQLSVREALLPTITFIHLLVLFLLPQFVYDLIEELDLGGLQFDVQFDVNLVK